MTPRSRISSAGFAPATTQAARELVERYEPVIRREVRMRLRDPRLYSRFDWTDICQSVMASFFVRAASGQYDLDQPDQLLRLLVVMTRHKLSKPGAPAPRGQARLSAGWKTATRRTWRGRSGAAPTPSRLVAGRELLEAFRGRLSDEERMLADLRAEGCEWAEICRPVRRHAAGTPHATGPRGRSRRAAARGKRGRP